MTPFNPNMGQTIKTNVPGKSVDRAFPAHFQIFAADAVALDTDGVHVAKACPAINVAAAAVIHAVTAITDILTITETVALGATANDLKVLLRTAGDDNLAVTKTDGTKTINIALAATTAAKNTAAAIQAAIRALTTVGAISVAAITCAAGGNWDTAAIATGETGAVSFSGGLSPVDVIITGITNPAAPRNITATAGGTGGDIKAVQVTVTGTNFLDEIITEVLPIFTVNTPGSVTGAKAFKTVTGISIPAHDGLGATTAIGWGDILGLPYLLAHNTVLYKQTFLNDVVEATEPTVTVSATDIEGNTIDLNSALNGTAVDTYLLV
jgi:hypothetical protein